jgi:hypothetical protein
MILRQFTFHWDYLKSVSVDVLCACTYLNICELQSLVTQALQSLLFVGPRVRTRLIPFVGSFASFDGRWIVFVVSRYRNWGSFQSTS